MKRHHASTHGFTLVELMVTLVVAFLVIAAVYASYVVQQRTQVEQQQVTRIQQNLRAALDMMTREFKMAGYDPTLTGEYGIITANSTTFAFEADLCEDGDDTPNPTGTVCPGPVDASGIPEDDEKPNAGKLLEEQYAYQLVGTDLVRTPGGTAIAENIEQIEFSYLMKNGSVQQIVPAAQLENIRAVRVTLLARADQPDFRYTNQQTYTTLLGTVWDPANAVQFPIANSLNYRRRILMATIELRNMGLL
jgi:type IV pilus assembly protein PilW